VIYREFLTMEGSISPADSGIASDSHGPSVARKRVRSNAQQMIGYDKAPDSLQAWIADSSTTIVSFSTETGRRMADYNVKASEGEGFRSEVIRLRLGGH
jgi:hypothetical protein